MSLSMAYDVARRPNPTDIWAAMTADLAGEINAARTLRLEEPFAPAADAAPAVKHPAGRMSRVMQLMAQTGLYDTNRYATDSDARQAIVTGAAAAGLQLVDVERRMLQGTWPGLASFYARYASRHRIPALRRDWINAVAYLTKRVQPRTEITMSADPPQASQIHSAPALKGSNPISVNSDAEHQFIRTWRNALRIREVNYQESRTGMARRMVLRSLGEAAHMTASRFIEFGVRSMAVATGLDHTTVAMHLRALRAEKDPLVTLVEEARGTKGDLYMLTVPEELKTAAEDAEWQKGKIHAVRPVFRELGLPAAFVYEALENSPVMPIAEIVRVTRLSRSAVNEALEILAAWNLVARNAGKSWAVVSSTSLRQLAEQLGVLEAVAAQLQRYRRTG